MGPCPIAGELGAQVMACQATLAAGRWRVSGHAGHLPAHQPIQGHPHRSLVPPGTAVSASAANVAPSTAVTTLNMIIDGAAGPPTSVGRSAGSPD
jgi:hypothetical protein